MSTLEIFIVSTVSAASVLASVGYLYVTVMGLLLVLPTISVTSHSDTASSAHFILCLAQSGALTIPYNSINCIHNVDNVYIMD